MPRLYDPAQHRNVYTWHVDDDDALGRPLKSHCWAQEPREKGNTRTHNAVVPDQMEVPE